MLICRRRAGCTLVELLVIVAVVALLIAIAFPAAAALKGPTRRTMCADNMRQLMQGMFAYASEHNGKGPIRGWFSYDLTEISHEAYGWGGNVKVRINLGMLHPTWIGANPDVLYCPATYDRFRDTSQGWKSAFNPAVRFTPGSYLYAVIFRQRALASPDFTGPEPLPEALWDSRFVSWIDNWEQVTGREFRMPESPALITDFLIGGRNPAHGLGMNVSYLDGHVRSHQLTKEVSGTWDFWYEVSSRP